MSRLQPKERKAQLLKAALDLAETSNYLTITLDAVAKCVGVSAPLVNNYFGTIGELREAVMEAAIETERLTVIAQGLVVKNPSACAVPKSLKDKVIASIGCLLIL